MMESERGTGRAGTRERKEETMLGAGLVFMLLLALAVYPIWPYSRQWGFAPSAVSGALLIGLIGLIEIGARL
jgi:hypothetical protein